ncbi:unnamed protein product [Gongylonema pulchrum]|uniref:FAT domain-containing protein n=1 Tax=Gongylonema pulchrum TaxID=637853 RepID=A0A183CYQ3_9BILA|nr:unnamed protein product [Gongylonema pulchrum]
MLHYVSDDWYNSYEKYQQEHSMITDPQNSVHQTENSRIARTATFVKFFGVFFTFSGKVLIKKREFYRAVHFLEPIKDHSPRDRFMYYWARYLACERNRLELEADSLERRSDSDDSEFVELHTELCILGDEHPEYFDEFLLYLLEDAKEAFLQSVIANRAMWPAWEELIVLVESVNEAESDAYAQGFHWMFQFFRAAVLARFELHKNAVEQFERLSEAGFPNAPYIMNQGMRAELAHLAHSFFKTHRFCWETCCIVGTFFCSVFNMICVLSFSADDSDNLTQKRFMKFRN